MKTPITLLRRAPASLPTAWVWPVVCLVALASVSLARGAGSRAEPGLTLTADTPWVISAAEPEAVQRALEDVKRDWYKVFGHLPVVVQQPPATWPGPVIYLGLNGAWLKGMMQEPLPGPESFVLRVQRNGAGRQSLLATGADLRGAIYAAYALSEAVLGVDPWYYWVDKEPAPRERIELPAGFNRQGGPPTFKYRGWFINDEDLLNGFSPDPLRENVFSLEMWDHICETLLRLHGNMLVPGTFTFPDERSQELASRRGLILNMHHILVLGLNTYRWPKDVPFSYSKNPELMERYWRTCIHAYQDREVLWTVGYRGKSDWPFWYDDPTMATPAARGAEISRVLARQVELVREVQPQASFVANIWSEGADLYLGGHLKVPPGVTVVWPDDGSGSIRDQGQVQKGQGLYYHTMMLCGEANQLSELVRPKLIFKELGRFTRAGATEYFLLNVSDIRPAPLSTDCAMRMAWNAAPWLQKDPARAAEEFLHDWSQRQFGPQAAAKVADIYRQYFSIPYQCQTQPPKGENSLASRLARLDRQADAPMAGHQGLTEPVLQAAREALTFAQTNRPYVAALSRRAEALRKRIPTNRRDFYQSHVLTPLQIHLHLLEMLECRAQSILAYGHGDQAQTLLALENALHASDALSACFHQAEYGKWAGWYSGERFVGTKPARERLRSLLAQLRGESPPPLRINGIYPELYQYQERFQTNFPLLYPPKP